MLVKPILWRGELPDIKALANGQGRKVLPFGYGRSYGDVCLNNGGILLDTSGLNRFLAFDESTGLIRCEAGVSLADMLEVIVPRGWFLPVTPGTKFVSVGGAIANDVHGKNHHTSGTFGCHVRQLELLRSDGSRLVCSPAENADLFRATIGGLGLTGVILWAEIQLKKIDNPYIAVEQIKFGCLEEFWEINADSDKRFEYTVSWLDCLTEGANAGRGHFMRGNHATPDQAWVLPDVPKQSRKLRVPVDIPAFLLNRVTVNIFNTVIYSSQVPKIRREVKYYEPFFYPLDSFLDWNRAYGKPGFLQYQFVVPMDKDNAAVRAILDDIRRSGAGSFLAVFKVFGDKPSPGMLSFPRSGVTLALDFAYHGKDTLDLLERTDAIVRANGGAVNPSKDARMSALSFQAFYPNWREFAQYIDPQFSSSFWRRVTQTPD